MTVAYDKYYSAENLFGKAYPELISFFSNYSEGKVLDLGCGQGRDAIPLARLGFQVLGIDNSKVGIDQMTQNAQSENLNVTGNVADIYEFNDLKDFDFVLFDNMFHFYKKDRNKETDLIKKVLANVKANCIIVFCIQDMKTKINFLNETLISCGQIKPLSNLAFTYHWNDPDTGHKSKMDYRLIAVQKK